jgi:hypothetical protein
MTAPSEQRSSSLSYLMVAVALVVVVAVIVVVERAGSSARPNGGEPAIAAIDFVSVPSGAAVNRADGGSIGVTPFTATFPRGDVDQVVIVSHAGYQDRRVTVPVFSETGRIDVTLVENGVDAAPSKPPKDRTP